MRKQAVEEQIDLCWMDELADKEPLEATAETLEETRKRKTYGKGRDGKKATKRRHLKALRKSMVMNLRVAQSELKESGTEENKLSGALFTTIAMISTYMRRYKPSHLVVWSIRHPPILICHAYV